MNGVTVVNRNDIVSSTGLCFVLWVVEGVAIGGKGAEDWG